MKRSHKILVVVAVLVVSFVGIGVLNGRAFAGVKFDAGQSSYIKKGDKVDGGLYSAAEAVRIEGEVDGDVYCAGQTVVITGKVNGDINCAGDSVTFSGEATGDVRLFGATISVMGKIDGDAVLLGQSINIESTAVIARDLTAGSEKMVFNGKAGRDFIGAAKDATINGAIGRNLEGEYEVLRIASGSTVGGFVHYGSLNDAVIDGKVSGEVKRSEPTMYDGQKASMATSFFWIVASMLVWTLLTALALFVIIPKKLDQITGIDTRQAIFAAAIGFMAMIIAPIFAVTLMITIVGLPLGLALLLGWIVLIIISSGVTSRYIARVAFAKQPMSPLLATLASAAILGLIFVIPIINIIAIILSTAFGIGALIYSLRGQYDKKSRKKLSAKS
ncbi:MAG: polymer-forming cytoskeletal protein [Candidatus Saccharimonadaceae bacterium]